MRVVVQIGFQKAGGRRREGQLVQAWVNDDECSWSDESGKYLTSRAETRMKGMLWYLWAGEVNTEDVIKIVVKTSLAGVGTDEERTFESLYYVDEKAHVREIFVPGVGRRKYPLLKGRVIEMGTASDKDKREAEVHEFLEGEF